jgi:L-ribulose-5-phosphate 3-epimerase
MKYRKQKKQGDVKMSKKDVLPIGMFIRVNDDPFKLFAKLKKEGFSYCQIVSPPDDYLYGKNAKKMTQNLKNAMKANGICVNSVFMSFKNQVWKYPNDAKRTIGLVPPESRAERIGRACRIGNWAKEIGVDVLASHVGFIPEDRNCELYRKFVDAMRELTLFLEANKQYFIFETGQESVDVLKHTMEDIGTENLGINFDPANLLLYDMDDPSYLVETLGKHVMHIHCKDGIRPVKKGILGTETPLGEGDTNFENLLTDLYAIGYRGPLTIEREISGFEQDADILKAKHLLERIKKNLEKRENKNL